MDKDFADRTTRVIIEKAAPFYAVRGILDMAESISMPELGRGASARLTSTRVTVWSVLLYSANQTENVEKLDIIMALEEFRLERLRYQTTHTLTGIM